MTNSYSTVLPKFHFIVEWGDNAQRMGFTEISGLSFETEVIEYREGGDRTYHKRKLPGLTKFGNITLKRGVMIEDFEMYKYWQQTAFFLDKQANFRRDVKIILLDDEHQPIIVWLLHKAWPCKVSYGDLRADVNEVLIESMELVHEGLTIANVS